MFCCFLLFCVRGGGGGGGETKGEQTGVLLLLSPLQKFSRVGGFICQRVDRGGGRGGGVYLIFV